MNILMLTCNNSLLDGINRHILKISVALNKAPGVNVAVCITQSHGELGAALQDAGIKAFSLDAPHGHALPIIWRFYRILKSFHPDVIHGHVISFLVGVVLRFAYHNKLVRTVHGIGDASSKRPSFLQRKCKEVIHLLSPICNYTCYISRGVECALTHSPGAHTTVYNPMDPSDTATDRKSLHNLLNLSPDTPIIGTACRISTQKAPYLFTQIMCSVLQQNPHAHAVLMGTGEPELEREIFTIISSFNMQERFHCLGYRQDAAMLMHALSCFVMTSVWEGMPTALLEAMAAGVPIAFLEGEGGLIDLNEMNKEAPFALIAPRDKPTQLADAITNLLNDPHQAKSLITHASHLLKSHFSTHAIATQLIRIYISPTP